MIELDNPILSWKHKNMDKWDSHAICGGCGKHPESRVIIDNLWFDPGNKKGLQKSRLMFDFHYHHLIYKDGIDYPEDVGIDLCNECHAKQNRKTNTTPINRFLCLMETTKRDDIKEWCKQELDKLRIAGKGRNKNTWESEYINKGIWA